LKHQQKKDSTLELHGRSECFEKMEMGMADDMGEELFYSDGISRWDRKKQRDDDDDDEKKMRKGRKGEGGEGKRKREKKTKEGDLG
jgi:hypothetical protein